MLTVGTGTQDSYSNRGDWIVTDPFQGNFLNFGIFLL